jgi:hypothetical protein
MPEPSNEVTFKVQQPDLETWNLDDDGLRAQVVFDANNSTLKMLEVSTDFFRTLLERAGFKKIEVS